MGLPFPIVVAIGGFVLVGAAVVLLLAERNSKARQTRIVTALKAYAPSLRDARPAGRTSLAMLPQTALSPNILLRTFGVRSDRSELYPAPWWLLVMMCGIVATVGGALGAAVLGPYGWLVQPVIWAFCSRALFGMFAARRARVLYKQMPDALSMIVRSVRTGIPVQEALRIVGREAQAPTAAEFDRVYNQLMIGTSLTEGLLALAMRTEVPEYRFFAVALALQGQTGGSLTDTLDNLAEVIRKRTAMRQRAYALSSEARTTMMVLASLPIVAFIALALITPDYMLLLVDSPSGRKILALAVIMMLMGIGSMQFMIRRALS